jgi:uncharacterized protein (DUF924 family)
MDTNVYYQKVRAVEANIGEAFPVVVSVETSDGGQAGTHTEVSRRLAAKLIVDGMARMASKDEAKTFRERQADAKRAADQAAAAGKVHVTVLTTAELNKLKAAGKAKE